MNEQIENTRPEDREERYPFDDFDTSVQCEDFYNEENGFFED